MKWFKHREVAGEVSGDAKAKAFFEAHEVVGMDQDGKLQFQPEGKVGAEYPIYLGTYVYNLTGCEERTHGRSYR